MNGDVLIIADSVDKNLYLASRNLYYVDVQDSATSATDPVALVKADKVIITEAALKEIEGLLK